VGGKENRGKHTTSTNVPSADSAHVYQSQQWQMSPITRGQLLQNRHPGYPGLGHPVRVMNDGRDDEPSRPLHLISV
jgi:hypothetical protein